MAEALPRATRATTPASARCRCSRRASPIQELERCIDQLGLQGVQIGSHINDWNLDAAELTADSSRRPRTLVPRSWCIPWDMMGTESMPKYWLPWLVGMPAEQSRAACCLIFGGVLERFRD